MIPSTTPKDMSFGLGSFPFARRYLGNRCFFLFLRVLRCFSSPGLPPPGYVFTCRYPVVKPGGFPHSDISGSMLVCSSPELFAACHVLLRLPVPRHPPYALTSLTSQASFVSSRALARSNPRCSCFSFSFRYAVFKVRWWRRGESNS